MKYELVLQFRTDVIDFDGLIELEDLLRGKLEPLHTVDGHDMGSGEANIFIYTREPLVAFEAIKVLVSGDHLSGMKAAYRTAPKRGDRSPYKILWPAGATEFSII
jgi:hypothetical protein